MVSSKMKEKNVLLNALIISALNAQWVKSWIMRFEQRSEDEKECELLIWYKTKKFICCVNIKLLKKWKKSREYE